MMRLLLCLLLVSLVTAENVVNFVLLGATGNLAEKYLWQGLYNIDRKGLKTGDKMQVYPAATKAPEDSAPILERILEHNITTTDEAGKKDFLSRVSPYIQLRKSSQYEDLGKLIEADLAKSGNTESGRVIYLSVPPKFFWTIADNINKFVRPKTEGSWLRVIVEKPFGVDLDSAEELADGLHRSLAKEEVLLVDHYMGKEGMHAMREFVHANPLSEFSKGRKIKHVEIGMLETDDVKGRTGFYDEVGVIRDTMQNHLMMMLSLLGMNRKSAKTNEPQARKEFFDMLRPAKLKNVAKMGQYAGYMDHINEDRAKWNEPPLGRLSKTLTYAHVVLSMDESKPHILNRKPLHFKSGKALDQRRSYAEIEFDDGEMLVFNLQGPTKQGVSGPLVLATENLPSFHYPEGWENSDVPGVGQVAKAPPSPFAYEVLLRAGLEGEREHFVALDEVLASWRVWTPLLNQLEDKGEQLELPNYKHGANLHLEGTKNEKDEL